MSFLPQLIADIQNRLGHDIPVSTDIPAGQTAWVAVPVFARAKQENRPLPEVAAEIAEQLRTLPNVAVEVTGGFVNVRPTNPAQVLNESSDILPVAEDDAKRTIVLDYSQPNIAKRMSVGHLRSTIIGDTLRALYESLGYRIVGINYLGDWGTQYGKLVVAYQEKYGDLAPRESVTIQELFELYVQYHADESSEKDQAARAMFKRLEDGESEVTTLWQFFVDLSLVEYQRIYDRLGVSFTEPKMGESAHRDRFESVAKLVEAKGIAHESDGAQIVDLPELGTPLILRKTDGATTYATRDLAALQYRVEAYQPEAIVYVVSNEQTLHFAQVFAVARMAGIAPESLALEHVKFGFVRLPEGKMSTRAGRVVFLDDVLDEAVRRARVTVEAKNPDLSEEEKSGIAEVVGIGALKYFDLSHDRKHDIVFDWDRMLQLTGDSGPYLQYSHVRAVQLLAKADEDAEQPVSSVPNELEGIVRILARFPVMVERAAKQYAPHILAQYLNQLAAEFHSFYEHFPVLTAQDEDRAVRLAIVRRVASTLKRGLSLLGIQAPDRM